jgi:ribosomal protein S18 acetylase RimI-like enzyme
VDPVEIVRFEDLLRRGWPALEVERLGGWILGTSGAYTRRANSVGPATAPRVSLEEGVGRVEGFYAQRGRPALFKLQPAAQPPELDDFLAARGYARTSETIVMICDSNSVPAVPEPEFNSRSFADAPVEIIQGRVDTDWFDASVAFSRVAHDRRDDYRAILDRILTTTKASLFGRLEREGRILSLALGCVVDDALSFVQVATAPEARGQGLAERVLRALCDAAGEYGAHFGLLSVEADNASACRLYDRLGFIERYRYWYREQSAGF